MHKLAVIFNRYQETMRKSISRAAALEATASKASTFRVKRSGYSSAFIFAYSSLSLTCPLKYSSFSSSLRNSCRSISVDSNKFCLQVHQSAHLRFYRSGVPYTASLFSF